MTKRTHSESNSPQSSPDISRTKKRRHLSAPALTPEQKKTRFLELYYQPHTENSYWRLSRFVSKPVYPNPALAQTERIRHFKAVMGKNAPNSDEDIKKWLTEFDQTQIFKNVEQLPIEDGQFYNLSLRTTSHNNNRLNNMNICVNGQALKKILIEKNYLFIQPNPGQFILRPLSGEPDLTEDQMAAFLKDVQKTALSSQATTLSAAGGSMAGTSATETATATSMTAAAPNPNITATATAGPVSNFLPAAKPSGAGAAAAETAAAAAGTETAAGTAGAAAETAAAGPAAGTAGP